jgi:hypothetical protein
MDITLFFKYNELINHYLDSRDQKIHIINNKLYFSYRNNNSLNYWDSNENIKEIFEELYEVINLYEKYLIEGDTSEMIILRNIMLLKTFKQINAGELWFRLRSNHYRNLCNSLILKYSN